MISFYERSSLFFVIIKIYNYMILINELINNNRDNNNVNARSEL